MSARWPENIILVLLVIDKDTLEMSSSKSPYDNLPPPRAESHVSSSTMNSKDGAQVSTKRGPDALSVASSPRKKQKAKKEATVLFALSRIKQAMQVEPPYVKLCKATGLLRRLIGEGAASYTAEERLKLLECLGCAFETFSTLDIDYALRSDLGSAFEDLFDSVTKAAEFETAPGMDKCIALAKTVIKMERADESFVFAKLVKFALSSLQTDLKTGALKEEKRSTESYEYNAVAHHLRSVYIAVAAKGKAAYPSCYSRN